MQSKGRQAKRVKLFSKELLGKLMTEIKDGGYNFSVIKDKEGWFWISILNCAEF
jgi:hypothetical protein